MFRRRHADLTARMRAVMARGIPLTFSELCAQANEKKSSTVAGNIFNLWRRDGRVVKTGVKRRGALDLRLVETWRWVGKRTGAAVPRADPAPAGVAGRVYRRGYRWGYSELW